MAKKSQKDAFEDITNTENAPTEGNSMKFYARIIYAGNTKTIENSKF